MKQRLAYDGSVGRIDLLNIRLDVSRHVVLVEELGEIVDEAVSIAHDDQRQLIRKLGLLRASENTNKRSEIKNTSNRTACSCALVTLRYSRTCAGS